MSPAAGDTWLDGGGSGGLPSTKRREDVTARTTAGRRQASATTTPTETKKKKSPPRRATKDELFIAMSDAFRDSPDEFNGLTLETIVGKLKYKLGTDNIPEDKLKLAINIRGIVVAEKPPEVNPAELLQQIADLRSQVERLKVESRALYRGQSELAERCDRLYGNQHGYSRLLEQHGRVLEQHQQTTGRRLTVLNNTLTEWVNWLTELTGESDFEEEVAEIVEAVPPTRDYYDEEIEQIWRMLRNLHYRLADFDGVSLTDVHAVRVREAEVIPCRIVPALIRRSVADALLTSHGEEGEKEDDDSTAKRRETGDSQGVADEEKEREAASGRSGDNVAVIAADSSGADNKEKEEEKEGTKAAGGASL
jgi:hypothetical protein